MFNKPDLYKTYEYLCKLKEDGKKIIGIIPHSIVPAELIYASNSIPLHFILGGTEDQMNTGHNYLAQATCGFQRVTLGIFEEGKSISYKIYDLVDLVIAGTFCAGVQNTGMYLEHYFKKKHYRVIIPFYNKPNPFNYYKQELNQLKTLLEKENNTKITKEKIIESIKIYNQLRTLYQELDAFRYPERPIISLLEMQNLIFHLYLNGPDLNLEELINVLL